jgi:uncharacterized protein involved in exopolysaccharide biosynthesis
VALPALIRKRWLVIVVSAVLFAIGSASWSALHPTLYEASTTIAVATPDDSLVARTLALANVRALFENHVVAAAVVQTLQLDQPPDRLGAPDLIRERLVVTQLRDSSNLRIRLRLSSPSKATAALGALTERVISQTQEGINKAVEEATGKLAQHVDEARQAMDRASAALLSLQQETQIDRLRKDVELALDQRRRPADEVKIMLSKLYESELELRKLEFEYDLTSDTYGDLVRRYHETRRNTVYRAVGVKVLDPAATSERPVSPRVALSAAIGGAAGLLLAVLVLAALSQFPAVREG